MGGRAGRPESGEPETSRTYLYFLVALVLLELLLGYELLVAHAVGQLHVAEALWFRWLPSVP